MLTESGTRRVVTQDGPLIGTIIRLDDSRTVSMFRGIPFAQPPVGRLRFKKPLPPIPWTHDRACFSFGNRAWQKDRTPEEAQKKLPMSEDCLFLNVFAPYEGFKKESLPVMVFIHGGGYCEGSAQDCGDVVIATRIASEEVVFVTIQYRLGLLGFFSVGENGVLPDNLGLWDQCEALRWVQRNISSFGGDSSNVTVFGQSAGGCSAHLLALSSQKHLFHRAGLMGGTANTDGAVSDDMPEQCRRFAERHGIPTDNTRKMLAGLMCLKAREFACSMYADTDESWEMVEAGESGDENDLIVRTVGGVCGGGVRVAPRLDGCLLPSSPTGLLQTTGKKMMVGVTEYEALVFFLDPHAEKLNMDDILAEMIPSTMSEYAGRRQRMKEKLLSAYGPDDPTGKPRALCDLLSDRFANTGTALTALINHSSTYLYTFHHFNPQCMGDASRMLPFVAATHCTDIDYVFHKGTLFPYPFSVDDEKVFTWWTHQWTNFARAGDPNAGNGPWTTTGKDLSSLSVSLSPAMQQFMRDREKMWLAWKKQEMEQNI